jgi:hypothetical protein
MKAINIEHPDYVWIDLKTRTARESRALTQPRPKLGVPFHAKRRRGCTVSVIQR